MIYLDNAATTRMYDEVIEYEKDFEREYFANPSALHSFGMKVEEKVKKSRKAIAKYLSANEDEIFFTKGATESNNIVIRSFESKSNSAITTNLEHSSVLDTFENSNFKEIKFFSNDEYGFIDKNNIENLIDIDTKLVSIIYVQNEIGTVQDIKEISKIIRNINKDIFIHIDATQALAKINCNVNELNVDAMSFSSHKIHGPKGIGALYVKKSKQNRIKTLLFGGRQELVSSGTLNAPAICAFSEALELSKYKEDYNYMKEINIYMRNKILDNIDNIRVNTPLKNSSPYILSISFEKIKSEVLLHMLEEDGIYVSSGSACSKGNNNRILNALNVDDKYKDGTIRFSFSNNIRKSDIDVVIDCLKKHIDEIRMVF